MEVTKVSQESLQKAMIALGLIEKAESQEDVAEKVDETSSADETEGKSEELLKAEAELAEAQAKLEQLKNPKKEEEEKTVDVQPIIKAEIETVSKGFETKIEAMATLIQSKDEKIEELTKAVSSINEFSKALAGKLGMIEKTPLERKSVTTTNYIDKFEKAEGGDDTKNNVRVMSISNNKHRAEIADELFKAATSNPEKLDEELAKAAQYVELRQVTPNLQQRLLKDFGIKVVR